VIALHEAQARLLALAPSLPREHVGVEDALGRYLAEPLLARRTQPSARLSAMDGYALATDDLAGPWRVVGESAAGHPFSGVVLPGQAIRISTGALMPDGGAVVLLQEDCAREGDILRLTGTPPNPPHKHIRMPGLDFTQGARLLPAGARVGAAAVALALSAGHTHVPVRRRPRVVVLDSGDELAPRGQECAPHQIPASNGAMLAAMLASVPCVVAQKGPIGDDLAALIAAFDAAGEADIIITSGGASVGDHDLLRPALAAWGAKIDFWRVALRPGKPLLIAQKGEQIIIGLPGNPVSSLVTAFLFVRPLLRAMLGAQQPLPRAIMAPLAQAVPQGSDRAEFLRAAWDGVQLTPNPMRDSSALLAMSAANALIERAPHAPAMAAGEIAQFYLLENGGIY
jgi:molybdopterin molybdotransferase